MGRVLVGYYIAATAALIVGISLGFWWGRAFPAHHYEKFGTTYGTVVLDTSTGQVCDAVKKPSDPLYASDPFAEFGGHALNAPQDKTPSIPFCGKR